MPNWSASWPIGVAPAVATDDLKAVGGLRPKPDLRLLVSGDGPGRAVLEDGRAGLDWPNEHFPGLEARHARDSAALTSAAGARPGEPAGALEAMALGTPVIAARMPDCRDLRNGKSWMVVPSRDVDQLTSSWPCCWRFDLSATLAAAGKAHVAESFQVAQAAAGRGTSTSRWRGVADRRAQRNGFDGPGGVSRRGFWWNTPIGTERVRWPLDPDGVERLMPEPLLSFLPDRCTLYGLERCFAWAKLASTAWKCCATSGWTSRQPDYLCRLLRAPRLDHHQPARHFTGGRWPAGSRARSGASRGPWSGETLGAAQIVMHLPERLGWPPANRKHRIKLPGFGIGARSRPGWTGAGWPASRPGRGQVLRRELPIKSDFLKRHFRLSSKIHWWKHLENLAAAHA
jgi:hypothetical protein